MLAKYIAILCLSLAAFSANGNTLSGTNQQSASVAEEQNPQMQGDLRQIPVSEKEIQLAFFAGLTVVFMVMVAVLFRKYKGKRHGQKDYFGDGYYSSGSATFTPTFFTSESSPAILVAQHNNDLRLFITNTLRLNYRVVSTGDGLEAFEKAVEIVPDVIITDRMMPGLDGVLLCRKLKSTEATSHIPVIILTSRERDLMTTDWHQYAADLMHSTFDARELLMRVNNLISARKKHQEEYRRLRINPGLLDNAQPEHAFLEKVMNALEANLGNTAFGVEQLAGKAGMTRLQLYRKIKALTTLSPGEFIKQYRLERAKKFLQADGSSVLDAAGRAGFNNISSFTKAFKDYTGKSPVEFAETNTASDETLVED